MKAGFSIVNSKIKNLIIASLFTAFICIGAWIKIPFVIVPMTLQFFFVNFAIISQKTEFSVLSVSCYICIGLMGLPVFSGGGGFSYILTPTFGYIFGFLLAALSSGIKKLREHKLIQSLVNIAVIYTVGLTYLYLMSELYLGQDVSFFKIIVSGFLIFIPKDLLSVFLSLSLYRYLQRIGLFTNERNLSNFK